MTFTVDSITLMTGAGAFIRLTGIFFALPFIGDPPIPIQVRVMLAVAFAYLAFSVIPESHYLAADYSLGSFVMLAAKELVIGIAIGYLVRIFLTGIVMAASLVGFQMGFGTESLMMADAGRAMTAFTAFHRIILILIFFTLDLHRVFFEGIFLSFRHIAPLQATLTPDFFEHLITLTAGIFTTAFTLATPLLVALMFTMAAMGVIARSVPQINIFTLSFPVSFITGMLVYLTMLPQYSAFIRTRFLEFSEDYFAMLGSLIP